jgi:hypothetical protein
LERGGKVPAVMETDMTATNTTSPIDPVLVAAIQILGGAIAPLNVAMQRLGWSNPDIESTT